MKNKKPTSPRIAPLAGQLLANPQSSKTDRQLAGSALAHAATKRRRAR